ncbi:MAG TPA: T9SS type A sorting domain-containing protein [Bacteroidota bacterium]
MKHWKRKFSEAFVFFGLLACAVTIALAWGSTGHHIINLKAPMHLPDSMGVLKADSLYYYQHASDADGKKVPGDTNFFAEAPRHFIDIDWYPNYHSLPHSRDSVVALYGWNTVKSQGVNPWATVMELDSLTAQLRRGATAKAESTMADIGHYVGDAHQPLHCANNFDGQFTGNNGVHSRYETSMINTYQSQIVIHHDSIHYIAKPLDFIFAYILHANMYVDSIMAADNYAKGLTGGVYNTTYYSALWQKTGPFTIDQFQRATVDLASLWYTAWVNSLSPVVVYDTVVTSVNGHGSISPSGTVLVPDSQTIRFVITPQTGYHVDSVQVDGIRVDSLSGYTFAAIHQRHTLSSWFSINTYTLTASSGANGSVAPTGSMSVTYGNSQSYLFTPATGYQVDSVIVDGLNLPAASSYSFLSVNADHTLRVTFRVATFTINAVAGPHGSISPPGMVTVAYGDSELYHIQPDSGYFVDTLIVDGEYLDRDTAYTFHSVMENHAISVKFSDGSIAMHCDVANNWNIISVPLGVPDYRFSELYPTAASPAFSYATAYTREDTLRKGAGYWVKFVGAQTVTVTGKVFGPDTIDVADGWNMIGCTSAPVPVSGIASIPPGITTSNFFGYTGAYKTTTVLQPGFGYWVKVQQAGQLVLASAGTPPAVNRIRISPHGEAPPSAPGADAATPGSQVEIPAEYRLAAAFPNPFNPTTTIHFEIPEKSQVSIKLYSLLGQEVRTILEGERSPGKYDVRLDASLLPSGVYLCRIIANDFIRSEKIVLLR